MHSTSKETPMADNQRLSRRSVGQFNPRAWLNEGDGLIASAKVTRELWKNHRQEFSESIKDRRSGIRDGTLDWSKLTGLPRASMLLLGYSVEMYLKAGLVKAYHGCSEEMFCRDVRGKFGHKLVKIAQQICFSFEENDRENLNLVKDMVLIDARYPVLVEDRTSHSDVVNKQTQRIWNEENFDAFVNLANRVKKHASAIDQDTETPAYFMSYNIDEDGYLAFRSGGHLPSRITFRVSAAQRREGKTSTDDVKSLFASDEFVRLTYHWDQAWIYEDGRKENGHNKTFCRSQPNEL